jgi:general secretion pathway protein F
MAVFRFVAIDSTGHVRNGTMEAPSAAFVIDHLQREGHIPMQAAPAGWRNGLGATLSRNVLDRRHLSRDDMALVLREMATLLGAGLDVDRTLRFIIETAPSPRVRRIIEQVRTKVRNGSTLSTALAEPPARFPRLHVGMVRAGEAGSTLADALAHLADMMDRQRTLARTITSALIYPAILVVASLLSIGFLVGYVLPQFAPLFRESGVAMPLMTRILLALGRDLASGWIYILLVLLLVLLAFVHFLQNPAVRLRIDRVLLQLPIVGAVVQETNAARFCRTLGTLVNNGIPLVNALAVVRQSLANRAVLEAIDSAIVSTKGGAGLSQTLAMHGVLPVRATQLLRLGEETAQLGPLAIKAADILETRTQQTVQRLVSLLVPVITIVMGGVVASIVASLLLAMLRLNNLAQ